MGVKQNFAALNVANEAKMAMGDAIGQVGAQVSAFSEKLQAAKNYGIAADASRQMQKKWGEFVDSRKGRDDEENWVKEWQDTATNLKSSVYDQHNPGPLLKKQLDQNFKDWELTNTIETKTIANKKAIGTANLRVDEAINEAAKTGHPEAAEPQIRALIDGKVSSRLIAPQQAKNELQIALNKVDEYGARNYITSNPAGAVDYLKEPKNFSRLDPDQRDRLLTEARVKMHQFQGDNAMSLMGEQPNDAMLDQKIATGEINERGAKQIKAYRDKTNYDSARANVGELRGDISDYDPSKDKDGKEYNDLKVSIRAVPDFMASKRDKLQKLLDDKKAMKGSSHGDTVINRMYTEKLFGDPTADRATWKKANDAREELQNDFEQWHQQNPGASNKEQYDYVWNRTKTNRGKSIVGTTDQFSTQ
jgi:hypothetical protein